MYVDLRTPGVRLPRARAHALLMRVRAAFAGLSGGIERIVVRVRPADAGGPPARDCEVEVHLPDGSVEVVHERRRRLGAVFARALLRAWQRTLRRLGAQQPHYGHQPLFAPLPARALATGRRSQGEGR